MKQPSVYILTYKNHTTLYTGVSAYLKARITRHKKGEGAIFTTRYNINKLVYHERLATMKEAIAREKQIKAGSRQKKIDLINSINPEWRDLYEDLPEV